MDDYRGEKFLDVKFDNLYNSKEVQHKYKPGDKRYETIRKYLERLEKAHGSRYEKTLLNMYYDKYVIKEDILREKIKKMYGDDVLEESVDKTVREVINGQKQSLHNWILYLSDPSTNYPTWAKYWAFQGMLKMGNYDEGIGGYQKRSKDTESPFVDANPEIIAKAIEAIKKVVDKEDLNDEELDKIIKIGSFAKLYTILEKRCVKEAIEYSGTEGEWVKYNQGSIEDAKKLSDSLQNKNTHWCTAAEDTAILQVCGPYVDAPEGGDFYVYYSKDKNNNYTLPRIAIRMIDNNSIAEIRGIEDGQNLEEDLVPILEEKLKSMNFVTKEDIKNNLDTIDDLKELTKIYKASTKKEEISDYEVKRLYTHKYGFGWKQDPRVYKTIKKRNIVEDYNRIKEDYIKVSMILRGYLPKDSISDKDIILKSIDDNYDDDNNLYKILYFDDIDAFDMYDRRTDAFNCASKDLKNDKEFVKKAISIAPWVFKYASDELKNDSEIMNFAISKNPSVFRDAPEKYKNDKELVIKIVSEWWGTTSLFEYVSDNLKKDEDVIKTVFASSAKRNNNISPSKHVSNEITDIDLIKYMYDTDINGRNYLREKFNHIKEAKEYFDAQDKIPVELVLDESNKYESGTNNEFDIPLIQEDILEEENYNNPNPVL